MPETATTSTKNVTAETHFAVLPHWLGDVELTSRAIHVYFVLRLQADFGSGDVDAYMRRKVIAKRVGCSVATVDRAVRELVTAGALVVGPHFKDGRQTSNTYHVLSTRGGVLIGDEGGTHERVGGVLMGDEGSTENPIDREPYTDSLARSASQDTHDTLVFALIDAFGWDRDEIPAAQWGRLHKAAKMLTDIGADPLDVPHRVKVYRVNFHGATMTPNAIAVNWAALATALPELSKREVQRASTAAATRAALEEIGASDE